MIYWQTWTSSPGTYGLSISSSSFSSAVTRDAADGIDPGPLWLSCLLTQPARGSTSGANGRGLKTVCCGELAVSRLRSCARALDSGWPEGFYGRISTPCYSRTFLNGPSVLGLLPLTAHLPQAYPLRLPRLWPELLAGVVDPQRTI